MQRGFVVSQNGSEEIFTRLYIFEWAISGFELIGSGTCTCVSVIKNGDSDFFIFGIVRALFVKSMKVFILLGFPAQTL